MSITGSGRTGYIAASVPPRLSVKRRGKSMWVFASGRKGIGHRVFVPFLVVALYVIGCGGGTGSEDNTADIFKLWLGRKAALS